MPRFGPDSFIILEISVGFESATALKNIFQPSLQTRHQVWTQKLQPRLADLARRSQRSSGGAGVSSGLPSPRSRPRGNAQQAAGLLYPLWSLIAMNNLATLSLTRNLMVSNCKYYKSGKVKATERSDNSFSILNGICSLLSSIVFYQLTFSKHKGFPRSGAPAGIWRKRYKLYRYLFF